MRLIGLCGKSGSGKSVFASEAVKKGLTVIDCDRLYASLVDGPSPCMEELVTAFGREIVNEKGGLDRKTMSKIVFSDRSKLDLLNSITHRHITEKLFAMLETFDSGATVILDAPTLFESGLDKICDTVISVIAPYDDCVARVMQRDGLTAEKARARIDSQKSDGFLIENSDILLYNDSGLDDFVAAAASVAEDIAEDMI